MKLWIPRCRNSAISVTEESIILAGTSKRVHGIFDLYPTTTREKMYRKIVIIKKKKDILTNLEKKTIIQMFSLTINF